MNLPHWLATVTLSLSILSATYAAESEQIPLAEEIFPVLKPILEKALEQSPQMLTKNIELAQADAQRIGARAGMLPTLQGSFQYTTYESTPVQNKSAKSKTDGLFYSLTLNQPIFHWGILKAQADVGKLALCLSQKQYAEAYKLLLSNVRSRFLMLIGNKSAVKNALANLNQAKNILETAEAKLKQGSMAPGEMVVPRLGLDESSLAYDKAVEELNYSVILFNRLTGVDSFTEAQIPDEIPEISKVSGLSADLLNKFVGAGIDGTLQSQMYRIYIKQSELNYKTAKFRTYPLLSFSAGVSQNNSSYVSVSSGTQKVEQNGYFSANYGLIAQWNIFDGFSAKSSKLSALATKRLNERSFKSYTDSTIETAKNLGKQIAFAARAMDVAAVRLSMAKGLVDALTEDAKSGRASQLEIKNANITYNYAQYNIILSRTEYMSKWAEFLSLTDNDPMLEKLPLSYRNGK